MAIPQSEPDALRKVSASIRSWVKMAEDRPCGTALFKAMASSTVRQPMTYKMGAKVSSHTMGDCAGMVTMAGRT